ncbi:hypothetical protein [Alloprevotella rava]|uniref:Uncharacterized protein n=1 Tax=Alloprevotella rava TaxID=671218 RepID=A0A7W5UFJ1_9BACT|nr:hypothetical protein [Alloprevotella rava]MBB3703319.1 hypothetical protein [Alloprevotella rava]
MKVYIKPTSVEYSIFVETSLMLSKHEEEGGEQLTRDYGSWGDEDWSEDEY